MFMTLGKYVHIRLNVLGLIYAATLMGGSVGSKYEFDACDMKDNSQGVCRVFSECQPLIDGIKSGTISIQDPIRCGFKGHNEIICCPTDTDTWQTKAGSQLTFGSTNTDSSTTTTTTTTPTPTSAPTPTPTTKKPEIISAVRTDRPAVEACRIIREDLSPILTPHILDGIPVQPGDYPHMAAIGYTAIGNEGGPYEFNCGGTLIHERFVLTAAHCVSSRNVIPAIVRLGMSNFDDADELPHRVEVPITKVHVHPEYSRLNKTNDVALLEFEKPVEKSRYVAPTCLYTKTVDPSPDAMLFVAGWGVYNYTTKKTSNALLKTRMQLVPDSTCIAAYKDQGYSLLAEHLCATDPKNTKDACWGDSGGPLLLHIDESILDFQQVGIISAGYGCAGDVPGLYMRVSAYLDYIENIVWPTN